MKGNTNAQKSTKYPIPDFANQTTLASSGWTTERTVANDGYINVFINSITSNWTGFYVNGKKIIENSWSDQNVECAPFPVKKGDKYKGGGGGTPDEFRIYFYPIRWVENWGGGV